ncbi:peptidyl-dipeptidase Dcp [Marinilabilia salmonicolor]|jgi:peptidyl-dipeptidase Dcp|uniref:M3 family metallopeptidase n=1 Tax=Marinilabilia salmonicolor TaxID=989 RepID=UPI000D074E95|nr:M3 family metallopeptidase [Marinilabilia salmonicolor]PRZ00200.1 peptidyl-dipeptidase Dcp [Marinilabilia salmonicolor]
MKRLFLIPLAVGVLASCQSKDSEESVNPFFAEYETPFEAPPFDEIEESHYLPAFKEGIKQAQEEVETIAVNPEAPTFENTILALDQSGELLTKVSSVFYPLRSAVSNDSIQSIAREISPLMSQHRDAVMMNMDLFARVKEVYENMDTAGLDDSQKRVVTKYYQDFVRSGANLNPEEQERLKAINTELSSLTLKFGEHLLAETNENFELVIEDESKLAGLPDGVKSAAADAANAAGYEGKWLFNAQKPSWIPFLTYGENRELREELYRGYFMRGDRNDEYDNKEIIKQIVALRAEKAELLGFDNHADYVIDVNMAKEPDAVYDFLHKLWNPALEKSKEELAQMQAIVDAEGGNFDIAPWDWWYYAEKLRKQKYDLDESQMQPYFKLENVRDGMFWVANQLYDITFEKRSDIPVYHEDVEVFEVKESDGSHIGLLYLDYFPRKSKRVGAWCTGFRDAGYDHKAGEVVDPLVSIVCNFTKPTGDTPSLLTWDEVNTLFHEFGHGLHGLFTEGKYSRTAGNVPRDFVELPSQIMENWCGEPEVLRHYAKHYETGEVLPDELIEKLQNSSLFNQGFANVEYLAASLLDMDWHTLTTEDQVDDVNAFEEASMNEIGLIPEILPRYRSTYFSHIFSGGYSAGYYVYKWAEVLDSDAFNAFKESGDLFNKELAAKFRKHCLQEVGEGEGMVQYKKFRGQEPSIEPLLEKLGFEE